MKRHKDSGPDAEPPDLDSADHELELLSDPNMLVSLSAGELDSGDSDEGAWQLVSGKTKKFSLSEQVSGSAGQPTKRRNVEHQSLQTPTPMDSLFNFDGFVNPDPNSQSVSGSIRESPLFSDDEPPLLPPSSIGQSSSPSPSPSDGVGRSSVVLIEPLEDEIPVAKFFSNDLKMAKLIAESPFGEAGIERLSTNRRLNIAVVTMKPGMDASLSSLLSISRLGDWRVRCRVPQRFSLTYGVIGPFGEEITGAEIMEELQQRGHDVVSANRITKDKNKTPTSMFKVGFATATLPTHVVLAYQRFKVSIFIDRPWQCYRCQRFGHTAAHCTSAFRCVACGGSHSVKDCSKSREDVLCVNCGGNHTASYGGCRSMALARQVERTRATQKLSYRDAALLVRANERKRLIALPTSGTGAALVPPSSERAPVPQLSPVVPSPSSGRTVATQTPAVAPASADSLITPERLVLLLCKVLALQTSGASPLNSESVAEVVESVLQVRIPRLSGEPSLGPALQQPSAPSVCVSQSDSSDMQTEPSGSGEFTSTPCSSSTFSVKSVSLPPSSHPASDAVAASPILGGDYVKHDKAANSAKHRPLRSTTVGKSAKPYSLAGSSSSAPTSAPHGSNGRRPKR